MRPDPADPFADYHRARFRSAAGRIAASIVVVGGLCAGLTALAGAAPTPVMTASETSVPTAAESPAPTAEAVTLPTQAPDAPEPSPPPAAAIPDAPGPRFWAISVDTTGYQAEIDQCLWVRMDLGLPAPIVGAHNYCGGEVVLDMAVGDTVTLAGTGLDGSYVVAGDRAARAGDPAAAATAGMDAAVILQTCTWADDGSVRLVALLPLAT